MADIGNQLSAELTRITDCPYPASLAHLVDLLARADVLTIRACIHGRSPCAVNNLATLVYEALSICAYALRALSSLSQSPEFRDALLLQNPSLLNSLLTKANSSSRNFDEYAELCVLLLSRPLPACIPLPASVQPFFLRVFENASQSPDVNTLRAVYSMLNGACGDLLRLLPAERREQFDQGLSYILSDHTTGQASVLLLWCFGIALIAERSFQAEHPDRSQETEDSSPAVGKRWKTAAAHKMFGSTSKMYKTIYLTYLSVIWATKGDLGVADDEAIEGIQIAIRTLQSMDQTTLLAWPRTTANVKSTIPRLPSKILRTNINPTVQFGALGFYALAVGNILSSEIITKYEQCLISLPRLVDASCLDETFSVSFPLFSPHIREASIQTLVNGILDACLSPPRYPHSPNYTTFVEHVTKTLPKCTSLHAKVLSATTSQELQARILDLIQFDAETGQTMCATHAKATHQGLVSATISMFLVLAFTAQPGGPTLPNNLTVALINKQKHLSRGVIQCSHDPRTSGVDTLSLFQQKNTPYTGVPLQDWRGRLRSELESQGHYQRDSVIRSVALICQDLESRCNIAEEPLLREKEKSQQLEETVADLNARLLFLESEATDTRFHLEGLEDEKLNLFDENERLSAKLNNLQADLDAASRNAAEMSHKHEGDIHAKDLELQSMTLSHEESLRTHCKQMEAQEETLRELRRDLQHISAQKAMLDNEHEALHIKFSTANQKLSDEVKNGRTQFEEIAQLRDRNTELELQLQSTQADLDTTTTRLFELQVGHQKLVHSSEQAYKDLESKYSTDMETAAAVVKETSETLNVQLQEALQYGHKAEEEHRDTRHELEQLQTSVSTLENRLQELADLCSEQEEELEELRALRKNVLAGLGLASQHPLPIRSTNRVQKDTSDLQNMRGPREHRRRKSAIQILDGAMDTARSTQGVTSTAMETIANASFASSDSQSSQNGPTPKRPKPRPSFKVPAIRTPYTQKPTLASRSTSDNTSPSKRSALRQLSPNRRHTTVGFAVSDDDVMHNNDCRLTRKRRGSLHGIHEADFDMDDFMAGTPMTPGNFATGTGRVPDDEDLTTTEL